MLYLISLGLKKEDISLGALEAVKECDKVYIDTYTSLYDANLEELDKIFNKKIIELERSEVESDKLVKEAKQKDIALLVIGDCLTATTHISLIIESRKQNIKTRIIHASSILTAIAEIGLSIYKFGAVTSIPFNNKEIKTTVEVIKKNQKIGLHSLILLDLNPKEKRYLTIKEALHYLIDNGVKKDQLCIGCSRLGKNGIIKKGKISEIMSEDFGDPPYCLIIPSNLNFVEEEALEIL